MTEQGWTKVPNAIARSTTLSLSARAVYIAVASRVNAEGKAWPSQKTIAADSGLSRGTASIALHELQNAGLLTWEQTVNEDGVPCGSSTYRLTEGVSGNRTGVSEIQTGGAQIPDRGVSEIQTQKKTHLKKTQEQGPPRGDVERICNHLADAIEANGSKRPTISTAWREAGRRLLDLDSRTEEQVVRAIDWCQSDSFWKANILSMSKLREKYDQLRLRAQADKPGPEAPTPGASVWDNNITQQRLQGASA